MTGNAGRWSSAQRGTSLMEITIVTGLILVLLSVAIPSFKTSLDKYKIQGEADAIAMQISLARSRALVTNSQVSFTFTSTDYGVSPADPKIPRQPRSSGYSFYPAIGVVG